MPPTEILRAPLTPRTLLCFAPHPDDEVLGCGGLLHLHARAGSTVHTVLATDGIHGDPERKFAAATYAERRRDESRRAAAVLGTLEPTFWGLPDSCEVDESDMLRVVGLVEAELARCQPDLVLLPWQQDNNRDHLVLHRAVVRGLAGAGCADAASGCEAWGYEVWGAIPIPDVAVDITEVLATKRDALAAFETQFAYSDLGHQVFGMNAYRSVLLERNRGYGEAFQRITVGS